MKDFDTLPAWDVEYQCRVCAEVNRYRVEMNVRRVDTHWCPTCKKLRPQVRVATIVDVKDPSA